MKLFYRPDNAVAGDVIPFYDQGMYKPFYLRNFRFNRSAQNRDGWVMLQTADHVHFKEHDTGIGGGTGSVIKVDGVYHMFYCTFRQQPDRNFINHAVSTDLKTWTPLDDEAFCSDNRIYAPVHWRDPFVFWAEEEKLWWMIFAAQKNGPTSRRGCVGLCKSTDLKTWRIAQPLYAPMNAQCAFECPDLFEWNGWYYLLYSSYADRFQTLYRMSRSLNGPWLKPEIDTFDTRAFYAAKTVFDGKRRLIYGWNPTRQENDHRFNPQSYPGMDCNEWDWGGSLIVHELTQDPDGTLNVNPLDTVQNTVDKPIAPAFQPLTGSWDLKGESAAINAPYSYASLLMNQIPPVCRLEMDVTYDGDPTRFGIALEVDEGFDKGYYLIIDPFRQRVEYRTPVRMSEFGGQCFPYEVEMERPLPMQSGKTMHITLLIEQSIVEAYFDNRIALGTRKFDLKDRRLGLFAENGTVRFENIRLYAG